MAAKPIRERLLPYKLLAYLLYTQDKAFIEPLGELTVRLITGEAARFLRMKSASLWEALYWLEKAGLINVQKERKRGSALITLRKLER